MILSDTDILKLLDGDRPLVDGLQDRDLQIQPASVDLRLSQHFIRDRNAITRDTVMIRPGEALLGSTMETVNIPSTLVGVLDGRSTLARQFILMHVTAGYIDPGFSGNITLEIVNLAKVAVPLKAGERVCQIRFHTLMTPCTRPYGPARGSQYHGRNALGTVPSGGRS